MMLSRLEQTGPMSAGHGSRSNGKQLDKADSTRRIRWMPQGLWRADNGIWQPSYTAPDISCRGRAIRTPSTRTLAKAASRCDVIFDVPYGGDYCQRLDIYRSKKASVNLPVLVFAHGGAWTDGYKEWMGLMAPAITNFPAIFVSVSHRLAPAHRYPDPFDDCMAAVSWVHRNIREYGGDPE